MLKRIAHDIENELFLIFPIKSIFFDIVLAKFGSWIVISIWQIKNLD